MGTKSVLFGVHQFVWHPYTVWRGWLRTHKRQPRWNEFVAIVCHDLGYWGCDDMDGESGRVHPVKGAEISRNVVMHLAALAVVIKHPVLLCLDPVFRKSAASYVWELSQETHKLSLGHSRFYAKLSGCDISDLFLPDKVSLLYDPKNFYLLRAWLSGEVFEYIERSPLGANTTPDKWFDYYWMVVWRKFAT